MSAMYWGAQSTSPLTAARLALSLPAKASMRMPGTEACSAVLAVAELEVESPTSSSWRLLPQ